MADSLFQVSAKWEGSLKQEVDQFIPQIKDAAHRGLIMCGGDMTLNLLSHIKNDLYEKWGDPLVYKRRKDHKGYGTSMLDSSNIHPDVKGLTLSFLYTPNAEHSAEEWSRNITSDELIEVIQTDDGWTEWQDKDGGDPRSWAPSMDTKGREIMPRPFWNNFVQEQRYGAIMNSFAKGFHGTDFDFVLEGGVLDLDFPDGESMLAGGYEMSDDEWLDSLGDW